MQLPRKVHIMEVGPRDGLQAQKQWVPTEFKIDLINALSRTGVPEIQVTSFVHPKAIPILADADEVMAKIDIVPGVSYRAMTPNMRGLQRALAFTDRINTVSFMLSVTESHNRANGNRSIEETFQEFEQMVPIAQGAGFTVSGSMICSLGCPFEGQPSMAQLEKVADRYLSLGVTNISLADTIGVVNPLLVYNVAAHMLDRYPQVTWNLHLHNTRDMALANTFAAMQAGITRFDGGIGGLGGCPYAPGASGNIATEDMVNMLHEMGIETGIDLDQLIAIAQMQRSAIPGAPVGTIVKAGKRTDLRVAPTEQRKIA